MPKLTVFVGSNIRAFRQKRGLTQEQLGERVNQPQPYIGGIERGEKNISLDTVEKISSALGIRPEELLKTNSLSSEKNEKDKLIELITYSLQKRSTSEIRSLSKVIDDLFKMLDANKG